MIFHAFPRSWQHLARFSALDKGYDMSAPRLKCCALLCIIGVALVDADHTGTRSTNVTQNGFYDLKADAELLHSSGSGPAQIVGDPGGNRSDLIQTPLRNSPSLDGSLPR